MEKNIMDVSRYQGVIDWDAVKANGKVDGVMLKTVSTNGRLSKRKDGLYIDPTFERNYAECKRVGLPVGVYYYTYATDKQMADAELDLLKTALTGKTFELPISVDVEDNKIKKLSTQELTDLAAYALGTVERWGFYALLYVGLYFAQTELYMGGAALRPYDVWLARYPKDKTKTFLSTPSARRATAKTERKPSAFVSLYTSLHKLQRGACKTNRKITPLLVQTAGIPVRSVRENHVRCLFALAGHQKISTLSCANSGCSPTCSTLVW